MRAPTRAITKIKEATGSNKPVIVAGDGTPTEGVRRSIYGVPVFAGVTRILGVIP
ncbi:MAG: hypothetical protein ACRDRX_07740 [Pseudonocardiaceae bacterium]